MEPDDELTGARTRDEAEASFLRRWSRRKAEAAAGDQPGSGAGNEPGSPGGTAAVPPRELTDEDLPPLETLGDDDDFSGFLSPGVSEALRTQALQRLFRSPKFNVPDGLDDYAGDFTQFAPLGDIVTADMKHQLERLAERFGEGGGADEDGSRSQGVAQGEAAATEGPSPEPATGGELPEHEPTTETTREDDFPS